MKERSLKEVESEINKVKEELSDVHGTETEVYARIVGYYRAVKNWNNGKKDEFFQRKMFTLEDSIQSEKETNNDKQVVSNSDETLTYNELSYDSDDINTFKLYTRETCPNCPAVKSYMENVQLKGNFINVDTEEGLSDAAENGVFATPTVIFYDKSGMEKARCHSVEELEAVFTKLAVLA